MKVSQWFFNSSDKFCQKKKKKSEELQRNLRHRFLRYVFSVHEQEGSFYVLATIPGIYNSNSGRDSLFSNILQISEDIYRKYSMNFYKFRRGYFSCFQLIRYSGASHDHYNFLVIRKKRHYLI